MRRRNVTSGVLPRLTVSLLLWHGGAQVSSEEVEGAYRDHAAPECASVSDKVGRDSGLKEAGKAVRSDGKRVEGCGEEPGMPVKEDIGPTALVDEDAGNADDEADDQAGEIIGGVGECIGTRFKKCR